MSAPPAPPLVTAIVVSHNTRDLLLQSLSGLLASDVPVQAVVVDNASADSSAAAVAQAFPQVVLVSLPRNVGFGRANNAGLEKAEGRFVLTLNPDVMVAPDCVGRLADFLLVHGEAGAVGPRLVRPDGRPDRAARRGFPTPATALYRLTGLSRLFPHSRILARYEMGGESPDQIHEIDAGTAACLMFRRSAIERAGFFDPSYFMYGEDLDLCYRIKAGGWKIYHLPTARAVHVKGAATRQRTARMLFEFHSAMWTFHLKHYADGRPAFFNGLIWLATWTRWLLLSLRLLVTRDPRVSP